jgi:hypothetical protein
MNARAWRALIAAVVALVVVVACCGRFVADKLGRDREEARAAAEFAAAPVPEVVLATPSAPPALLQLPAYTPDHIANGDFWPRACSLLALDDIRAVLPEADLLTPAGGPPETIKFITSEYHPPEPWEEHGSTNVVETQVIDVPEPWCDFTFWLPHKSPHDGKEPIATVTVHVHAAGDPTVVWGFAFGGYLDMSEADVAFAKAHGARACKEAFRHWTCTRGPLTVEVRSSLWTEIDHELWVRMPGQPVLASDGSQRFESAVNSVFMALLLAKIP